jgi:hypothetical protein
VSDGTRTRDRLDHNQELYQLSYAHQAGLNLAPGLRPGLTREVAGYAGRMDERPQGPDIDRVREELRDRDEEVETAGAPDDENEEESEDDD